MRSLLAPQWSVEALLRRAGTPIIAAKPPIDGDALAAQLARYGGEALVSVGFSARIPEAVRALYPAGAINVHPALLPNHRGPHPLHAMVLDKTLAENAGVTIHVITDDFDEGPIVSQARLPKAGDMPLAQLEIALSRLGAELLLETLDDLSGRIAHAKPQPPGEHRVGKLSTEDVTFEPGVDDAALDALLRLARLATYPQLRLGEELIRITNPVRRLAAATGEPAKLSERSVEFDTRTSRVRAVRARKRRRRLEELGRVLRLARARGPLSARPPR